MTMGAHVSLHRGAHTAIAALTCECMYPCAATCCAPRATQAARAARSRPSTYAPTSPNSAALRATCCAEPPTLFVASSPEDRIVEAGPTGRLSTSDRRRRRRHRLAWQLAARASAARLAHGTDNRIPTNQGKKRSRSWGGSTGSGGSPSRLARSSSRSLSSRRSA